MLLQTPNRDGEFNYAKVWSHADIGILSNCCKKEIMTFEPRDVHQSMYTLTDLELPPDFGYDRFVSVQTKKDVSTEYKSVEADFYKQ
jgi:hypothetical protein